MSRKRKLWAIGTVWRGGWQVWLDAKYFPKLYRWSLTTDRR